MYYYLSGLIFGGGSFFFFFFGMLFIIMKFNFFFEWNVLTINSFMINMYMYIDWMSLVFLSVVMIISSMIMFYSSEYMIHDKNLIRFFFLVFMFIISMFLMILSPNLISILIGWDGLGLVSYCLVIYYQSFSSFNSGMLTVLMNRIGDVLILLSLGILLIYGSWNFLNLNNLMSWILLLIVLASFTKSAQFPFSSWLPAAMAAPTPVSSLVHSSTLVTAGVYLIIRFHFLIFKFYNLLFYIFVTGLLTMILAGFSANLEFDFKKIIAYSTLSQLGLMMMIIGFKNFELSFFHLVIHAMFKSMMFMCSGVVIHCCLDYQDIRFMGYFSKIMPLTSMIFMTSNFSLCGMPFFSGFYSKDMILEFMLMSKVSMLNYFFILFGTGLTVSYSVRLSYYLMSKNFNFLPFSNIQEFKIMNFSMIILFLMTVFFGMILNWVIFSMIEEVFMLMFEKILILLICLLFFFLGNFIYKNKINWKKYYFLKIFFGKMWFLYLINKVFSLNFLFLGFNILKITDKSFNEWMFYKLLIYKMDLIKLFFKLNFNYFINLIFLILLIIIILFFLF